MSVTHDSLKPLPVDAVRMLAIDLDGTLLRTDGSVSQANIKAVQEAKARGIRVLIATARPPRGAIKAYQQLQLDTLMVCHNGALIYDAQQGRAVDHQPLSGIIARKALDIARRLGGTTRIGIDVVDTLYIDRTDGNPGNSASFAAGMIGGAVAQPISFDHVLNNPVTKVFMIGAAGPLAEIQLAVHQVMQGQITFATSHLQLLQIVRAGVDKAVALAKLAQHYGIKRESVMVIGDAPNDLGMMKWAGLAVAMKNGWRDAINAANFVVAGNDQDGVAEAIERFVLA